ncbi:MAG: hypothetical protein AABY22_35975 [Nanoarchaeota archaeon]
MKNKNIQQGNTGDAFIPEIWNEVTIKSLLIKLLYRVHTMEILPIDAVDAIMKIIKNKSERYVAK